MTKPTEAFSVPRRLLRETAKGAMGMSLHRVRRLAVLAALAAIAALSACGDSSAPTSVAADTPASTAAETTWAVSITTATSTAASTSTTGPAGSTSPTSEPAGGTVDADISVDTDTVWEEVFSTFTVSERSCIRDAVDEELLESVLDRPVLESSEVPEQWEVSIFSCLAPRTARALFLSFMIGGMEDDEELAMELTEEELSCLGEWVAGIDVAATVAALADEDPAVVGELTSGMFSCLTNLFLSMMVSEMGMDGVELSEEELSCLREWVAGIDMGALIGGFEDEDPTVLDEFVPPLLGCVPDVFLAAMLEEAGMDLGELAEDEASCLREWLTDADWSSFFAGFASDDPSVLAEFVPGLLGCVPDVFLSAMLDEVGVAFGELAEDEASCLREWLTDADFGALFTGDPDAALGFVPDLVECIPDLLDVSVPPQSGTSITIAFEDATAVAFDEEAQGELDEPDATDLFVFDAEEGSLYQIDVALGTLVDSVVTLYDSEAALVEYNDDYGGSSASRILWVAPGSGSYYVEVGSWGGGTGSYTLTVVASDIVDDHADTVPEATSVTVGDAVPGGVDHPSDVDLFVFDAVEGSLYQIDVALGTLVDSVVTLYDSEAALVEYNDDYGGSSASRILWVAPGSGSYYVEVGSWGGGTGSYTLTVVASDVVDDHADTVPEATSVTVGDAVPGGVDHPSDVDLFVFDAVEGSLYQIDVALGTLVDSVVTLYDSEAALVEYNDDYGGSSASRIFWVAPGSGSYYVEVGSWGGGTGSYTLTVVASDIVDDHADTVPEATSVTVGGAVLGVVDYPGDFDLFVFDTVHRELYQIDVALGTLGDSVVAVYDADETELAFNDDYEGSFASRVFWEAPTAGRYYVAVASPGDGTGSYTLTIITR